MKRFCSGLRQLTKPQRDTADHRPSLEHCRGNPEGGISKLDESCISDPKSEISNWTALQTVQSRISDFGFEMQDSSNFKMPFLYSHSQFEAVFFFELFVTFGLCATEDDV
jgi:hypothetical protein